MFFPPYSLLRAEKEEEQNTRSQKYFSRPRISKTPRRFDSNASAFYLKRRSVSFSFPQRIATIAGVVAAFTVPATPHLHTGKYINYIKQNIEEFPGNTCKKDIILNKEQINALKCIESASDRVISPLQSLEDDLHALVNYVVIPLFAFANAGIVLTSKYGGQLEIGLLTWAVMIGLIVGKFVGIYLFTWLAIKCKLSSLVNGMTWSNLAGISMLGGIGFTVSLFISNLSFGNDVVMLSQAKLGVLLGTMVAGIWGCIILHFTLPKQQ